MDRKFPERFKNVLETFGEFSVFCVLLGSLHQEEWRERNRFLVYHISKN